MLGWAGSARMGGVPAEADRWAGAPGIGLGRPFTPSPCLYHVLTHPVNAPHPQDLMTCRDQQVCNSLSLISVPPTAFSRINLLNLSSVCSISCGSGFWEKGSLDEAAAKSGAVPTEASFPPLQLSERCRRSPATEQASPHPSPSCRILYLIKSRREYFYSPQSTGGEQTRGNKAACPTAHMAAGGSGLRRDSSFRC